ncbi:MAG: SLBB domain-containing protein [Candidatus Omnitrophica bacterium]|nr:SLBB domain-containing protein [Candidatus Omnitrophota bacterium]MCM8802959.1 SLBB domain-containing protein [Candidatus Omnitrophota bacterium]
MEKRNKFLKNLIFGLFIFQSFILNSEVFPFYSELKIFGQDFFENYNSSLKTYQLPLSDDYIIGPQDTIIINVWGFFEQEYQKEVEIDGSIFIPGIGKIYLAGKSFKEVKKVIEDKFYKKYKNIQVSVSGGKVKTINIYILGEVKKPGAYEIPPFVNIIDVLAIAGGPNKNGSLRKIEIIKSNNERKFIDIYPILIEGEKPEILQFQTGDVVFVHPSENLVGITGGVRKPAIYELKSMKFKELIDLSGGFLPIADTFHIQIERIDKEKGKILIDIDEKELYNLSLKNFDIIKVPLISSELFYQISVTGAVKTQRVYGWKEGIKIGDILKEDDLLPFAEKERAEIIRIEDGYRKIITFSPKKIFSGDNDENLKLLPQDKIVIYSRERPEKKVTVIGEVRYPGEYVIEAGEKISNIIKRAGNFTSSAYPKGIVFLRETVKKQKEKQIEKFVKEKREVLKEALKTTTNIEEKQVIERTLIALEKLAEVEPQGRIVIKMDKFEEFENSIYDIALENGDIIYIPKKPVYVSVIGEVNNPANVLYDSNLTLNDYIQKTGGFTKDADRKNIFIVRVDGSSDKNLERIESGDTIIIPFEPKGEKLRFIKDIIQIFYQLAVGIGVLLK